MASVTVKTSGKQYEYIQFPNNYGDVSIPSGSVRADVNSGRGGGGSYYKTTFTSANLSANILSVNHRLNKYVVFTLYDSTGKVVQPSNVTYIDLNNISIDLSGLSVTGTWTIALG